MTHDFLEELLLTTDISKGRCIKKVDDIEAIFMKNIDIEEPCDDGDTVHNIYDYIVLVKNNFIIGGILKMTNNDVHIIILEKYRGKGYMSKILKNNFLRRVWPNANYISCNRPSQYFKVKYLIESSGHKLVDITDPVFEDMNDLEMHESLKFDSVHDITKINLYDESFYDRFIDKLASKNIQHVLLNLPEGGNIYLLVKNNINYIISIDSIELFKNDKYNSWHCMVVNTSMFKNGIKQYCWTFDIGSEEKFDSMVDDIDEWLSKSTKKIDNFINIVDSKFQ